MVVALLAALAQAAPVQCDALEAARVLAEARVEEDRALVTHPELIPGMALASAHTSTDLRSALDQLCAEGSRLSLVPDDQWTGPGWVAYAFLLTRTETVGCTLFRQTIAVTVGVSSAAAPTYGLRSRYPVERSPVGECATLPTWREEEVIAGADGSVRLVLAQDMVDGERLRSSVLVRRASPEGWSEDLLMAPASPRLMGGGEGPLVDLTERFDDKYVVAHANRSGAPPDCVPIPGQTVWAWRDDEWVAHRGRDALGLLAQRGLWRLAGEDGWMLLLSQVDEDDPERLEWRRRKWDRTSREPLYSLPSGWFPGLNAGFLVVTPAPWSTRADADLGRTRAPKWRRAYVKRAWTAVDPCAE